MITVGILISNIINYGVREIQDTDTGGHYTLKRYRSEKESAPDGTWRHTRIVLRPESDRDGYEPIVIEEAEEAELHVIAELIGVIQSQGL